MNQINHQSIHRSTAYTSLVAMLRTLCCCFDTDDRRDTDDESTTSHTADQFDVAGSYAPLNVAPASQAPRALRIQGHLLHDSHARSDDIDDSRGGESGSEHVGQHVRSTSAPPRGVLPKVFYEFNEDEVSKAGTPRETRGRDAYDVESGSDASRGDGKNHKRSASVTFGSGSTKELESMKREFARLTTSLRGSRRDESSVKEGFEGGEDFDACCPTCFEEYDPLENPRMTLKCGHHFHLACILEWQEYLGAHDRDDSCPVCDAPIEFDEF